MRTGLLTTTRLWLGTVTFRPPCTVTSHLCVWRARRAAPLAPRSWAGLACGPLLVYTWKLTLHGADWPWLSRAEVVHRVAAPALSPPSELGSHSPPGVHPGCGAGRRFAPRCQCHYQGSNEGRSRSPEPRPRPPGLTGPRRLQTRMSAVGEKEVRCSGSPSGTDVTDPGKCHNMVGFGQIQA